MATDRSSLICEVVTLSPEQHLPYVFELRTKEVLEFMLASNVPIDVLFCKMDDYDAWMEARRASLLGYMEAAEILVYAMTFAAPSEDPYAAVLINGSESPADIAVEIRLSLPEVLW